MPASLCQNTRIYCPAHVSDNVKGHVANHVDVAGAVHRHGLGHLEDEIPRLGSVVRMGPPMYYRHKKVI